MYWEIALEILGVYMKTIIVIAVLLMIGGCAGRTASPVMPTQYRDKGMSCEQLTEEMHRIEVEIRALYPRTDKMAKNVAWGIAGFFFFPLWLGMDLSDAEKIEIDAYKARYENLRYLSDKNSC